MTDRDESEVLRCARDWKAGHYWRVHPTVARMLNSALVRSGEDPVPFARSTSHEAPSLADLIESRYRKTTGDNMLEAARASDVG